MQRTRSPIAYHLIPAPAWRAAPEDEPFRPVSLEADGFVHLTHLVLTVALARLSAPWRYDGDERYPHAYGPLDRAAITEVCTIARDATGAFLPIEPPDGRRAS